MGYKEKLDTVTEMSLKLAYEIIEFGNTDTLNEPNERLMKVGLAYIHSMEVINGYLTQTLGAFMHEMTTRKNNVVDHR